MSLKLLNVTKIIIENGSLWTAYYASITKSLPFPPSQSYMLTLFMSPTSPTMAWHSMKILRDTTKHLNPNQSIVMVADQSFFALAKKIQWKFPQTKFVRESFLVILGLMHTKKMLWSVSADWFDCSG